MGARLKEVKKLEERIAPSSLGIAGDYRCGNGPNGEVGGYPGGHIDASTQVDASANVDASATADAAASNSGMAASADTAANADVDANVDTNVDATVDPTTGRTINVVEIGVINLVDPGDGDGEWQKF
jgi:hypothetical protein